MRRFVDGLEERVPGVKGSPRNRVQGTYIKEGSNVRSPKDKGKPKRRKKEEEEGTYTTMEGNNVRFPKDKGSKPKRTKKKKKVKAEL